MARSTKTNPGTKRSRGVQLNGEVLAMVEAEQGRDNRPSLTNTIEQLIREAVEARKTKPSNLQGVT